MSKYTTEVRYICEWAAGYQHSKGYNSIDSILNAAVNPDNPYKVFDFDFPIYDEAYRVPLEKKILRHYYTREICEETIGLWKLRMEDRLNTIMPYYNQLYRSALLEFNPLWDVEVAESRYGVSDKTENGDRAVSDVFNENAEKTTDYSKGQTEIGNTNENVTKTQDQDSTKTGYESKSTEHSKSQAEAKSINEAGSGSDVSATTQTGKSKNNSIEHNSNSSDKIDKYSETPQGKLDNLIAGDYLTNARIVDNNEVSGSTVDSESTDSQDSHSTSTSDSKYSKAEDSTKSENSTNSENNVRSNAESVSVKDEQSGNKVSVKNTGGDGQENEKGNKNAVRGVTENKKNVYNSTENYINAVAGKRGPMTYSRMLIEFRDTFINIDEMIINNLSDLFFGLW